MAKYLSKVVEVEAHQWFKNGDHPDDKIEMVPVGNGKYDSFPSEGKVVRHYRHPRGDGAILCSHEHCQKPMHDHGWIDTLEGGHIVCPGDYIVTGLKGERYPVKPDIFAKKYEPVSHEAEH